jgi:DNA-binding LacI/PurR family transcriptional regulator
MQQDRKAKRFGSQTSSAHPIRTTVTAVDDRPSRVSIRDVARAADMSITTVSQALNGKGRVGSATRSRIIGVARQLGYRPNRAAQELRSGRAGSLGMLMPLHAVEEPHLFDVDFYMELTLAAVRAAFDRGLGLVMLPALRSVDEMLRFAVDGGIVVSGLRADERLSLFDAAGLPVVTVDQDPSRTGDTWWVGADNTGNARTMLDHLFSAGARRIALLTVDLQWSWIEETVETYTGWSAEYGAEPTVVRLPPERCRGHAEAATVELLSSAACPDAIFAAAQWVAEGAAGAVRRMGLRIPEDVLLATGVDSQRARAFDPPLTALDLHPARVAEHAVELLLARIEGEEAGGPRIVTGDLRARSSTDGDVGGGTDLRRPSTSSPSMPTRSTR